MDSPQVEIPGFERCAHAVPQTPSCLHGICIFCYRDRLGAVRQKNTELQTRLDDAVNACNTEHPEVAALRKENDTAHKVLLLIAGARHDPVPEHHTALDVIRDVNAIIAQANETVDLRVERDRAIARGDRLLMRGDKFERRVKELEQQLKDTGLALAQIGTEVESLRAFKRSVDEALSSEDGAYRP